MLTVSVLHRSTGVGVGVRVGVGVGGFAHEPLSPVPVSPSRLLSAASIHVLQLAQGTWGWTHFAAGLIAQVTFPFETLMHGCLAWLAGKPQVDTE